VYLLSVTDKILGFLAGFGILQGVLLAGLLYFHPRSDKSVNKFLALYILSLSAVMSLPFTMDMIGWMNSYFLMPLPLLLGVLLYFYILSFKETVTWQKAWPHFIIFFLFFFAVYWNISKMGRLYPSATHIPVEGIKRPSTIAILFVRTGQNYLYYFLSRRALNSYQRSIKQLFSETSRIDLQWTRFLVNGFAILITTFVVIFPLLLGFPDYFNSFLLLNMAVATPYIYMAAYKGFIQPTIWQIQAGVNKQTVEEEIFEMENVKEEVTIDNSAKTSKPKLPDNKIEEIVRKVTEVMETDRLYQEPELTLQQLADKLQYPYYQVSQAINDGMNKNFYDLVNNYRIEEAKRLLLDPKNLNYTVLSVGFEAGFNSKTTFNTVFKKFTGLTPTEYRQQRQPVSVSV
jgi:AraC-like DNA-binding protein